MLDRAPGHGGLYTLAEAHRLEQAGIQRGSRQSGWLIGRRQFHVSRAFPAVLHGTSAAMGQDTRGMAVAELRARRILGWRGTGLRAASSGPTLR